MTIFDKVLSKKEMYINERMQINNYISTADKLGFNVEVVSLQKQKRIITDFIDALDGILQDMQNDNNL